MSQKLEKQVAQRKRELRTEIARSRVRIERRAGGLSRQTRRLLSWRTLVRQFPLPSVLAALGLGFFVSGGLGRRTGKTVVRASLGFLTAIIRHRMTAMALSFLDSHRESASADVGAEQQ